MMNINIKRLHSKALNPSYGTPGSAGLDLGACIDSPLTLEPGQTELVPRDWPFTSMIPVMRQ